MRLFGIDAAAFRHGPQTFAGDDSLRLVGESGEE